MREVPPPFPKGFARSTREDLLYSFLVADQPEGNKGQNSLNGSKKFVMCLTTHTHSDACRQKGNQLFYGTTFEKTRQRGSAGTSSCVISSTLMAAIFSMMEATFSGQILFSRPGPCKHWAPNQGLEKIKQYLSPFGLYLGTLNIFSHAALRTGIFGSGNCAREKQHPAGGPNRARNTTSNDSSIRPAPRIMQMTPKKELASHVW